MNRLILSFSFHQFAMLKRCIQIAVRAIVILIFIPRNIHNIYYATNIGGDIKTPLKVFYAKTIRYAICQLLIL